MLCENLVSIVIPVYNTEKYIEKCILSVINQTYENIEIIIVNDGSSDESLTICQYYAGIDSRIKLINKKNEGVSQARNEGLKYVNGDFLIFIDSDDWIEREMVGCLVQKALSFDADVVIFGWVCEGKADCEKKIVDRDFIISRNELISEIIFDNEMYGGGYTYNKFWNYKKLKNNFTGFNENLYAYEDNLCVIKNYLYAQKILMIPEVFYHYLIHSNSLSHRAELSWDVLDNIVQAYFLINKALGAYEGLNRVAEEKYYFEIVELLGTAIKQQNLPKVHRYFGLLKGNISVILKSSNINLKYKCKEILVYIIAYLLNFVYVYSKNDI